MNVCVCVCVLSPLVAHEKIALTIHNVIKVHVDLI
jgi:hypothetical protein